MRVNISSLARIMVLAAMMTDGGIAHSFAQTTTTAVTPDVGTGATTGATKSAQRPARRRRVVRPTANAAARNEGPSSSVTGNGYNDLGNSNSGLPRVSGAPAASGNGSTGGH